LKALDANHLQAKAEVAAAARFLVDRDSQTDGTLAVIGFSLGAYYAVDLSLADPEHVRRVVVFYGTGPGEYNRSRADYLGHFAEVDVYEPRSYADEMVAGLRQAGRPVTFHYYPGTGHWFFEPDRLPNFNPAAASLAWDRTLAFLRAA
jgi:carboxymethylenebutenolidase